MIGETKVKRAKTENPFQRSKLQLKKPASQQNPHRFFNQ
jgi:hypothetical protein